MNLLRLWNSLFDVKGNTVLPMKQIITGSTISSPVKVCMAVNGVEVQPAKKGVNPGKGHHHLLN